MTEELYPGVTIKRTYRPDDGTALRKALLILIEALIREDARTKPDRTHP